MYNSCWCTYLNCLYVPSFDSKGELRRPFKHFTRSGKGRDSRVPPTDFSIAMKDLGIWVHHDFILYEILWFYVAYVRSCIYLFVNTLIIADSSYLWASRVVPSRMIVPFIRRFKNIREILSSKNYSPVNFTHICIDQVWKFLQNRRIVCLR